jgi:hypothetical protein
MTRAVELAQVASLGVSEAFKNRIINGAMVIDQRNAGASATLTNTGYSLDRWQTFLSPSGKYTVQQNAGSVTPPVGFTNYLGVTSTSAYSVSAGDYQAITQPIEGYNIADLGFGTANAKTVTLSFWVRSSLTGTFGGALANNGASRSYPFTYTISAANTWEQKSVTIAGDTSGTWATTSSYGLGVIFGLGVGSTYSGTAGAWASANYQSATGAVSVVGTNGATFYITGVQLEVGSSATSFEYLDYGNVFRQCQRYYYRLNGNQTFSINPNDGGLWVVTAYNSTSYYGGFVYPVIPRTGPTWSYSNLSNMVLVGAGGSAIPNSFQVQTGINRTEFYFTTASGWLSAGQSGWLRLNQNDWFAYSAEL